jgi:hypothetical protein
MIPFFFARIPSRSRDLIRIQTQRRGRRRRTLIVEQGGPRAEAGPFLDSDSKRSPILPLHHLALDPRCVVATIPYSVRHEIYRGQLVYVGEGNGPHREGAIEITAGVFALVRLHVVGSRQPFAHKVLL